jgi:SGNH domain (fused to AT3 domains)
VIVALFAVLTLSGGVLASAHARREAVTPMTGAKQNLTDSQLAVDLREGVRTQTVPSNLEPPLALVHEDRPLIQRDGCFVRDTGVVSEACAYGDTASNTVTVLFGDSHAASWFPALDTISKQKHWRLVVLAKAGCPAEEVNVIRGGGVYTTCAEWRSNAVQRIATLHPALVVVTSSDYPGSLPLAGVPTGYGGVWQDGAAATFSFLRQSASHVVFISDIPRLRASAPHCLASHMSDVPRCAVARSASVLSPELKTAEFQLAQREHIASIDPTSWFCTRTTCPVIVGNLLIYGDSQHMLPAWSRFLAPVLARRLTSLLKAPAG